MRAGSRSCHRMFGWSESALKTFSTHFEFWKRHQPLPNKPVPQLPACVCLCVCVRAPKLTLLRGSSYSRVVVKGVCVCVHLSLLLFWCVKFASSVCCQHETFEQTSVGLSHHPDSSREQTSVALIFVFDCLWSTSERCQNIESDLLDAYCINTTVVRALKISPDNVLCPLGN